MAFERNLDAVDEEGIVIQQLLAKSLGSFRAENLERRVLFELYTAPSYFPELLQPLPCFLQGGRGTGKTTVLRYLSYEAALAGANEEQPFHGLYVKFERSEISAFKGAGLDDDSWSRLFAHYMNLVQCLSLLEYVRIAYHEDLESLQGDAFQRFTRSLRLSNQIETVDDAVKSIYDLIIDLQHSVNNIQDKPVIDTSTMGVPVKYLVNACDAIPKFSERQVAFLFDEFEVLRNYQQRVVNTLIKEANDRITFKIGVREEGLRERVVVGGDQEIRTPADYALVRIEERLQGDSWGEFATMVVSGRLTPIWDQDVNPIRDLQLLFPSLTTEEEAILLGAKDVADRARENQSEHGVLEGLTDYEVFFADFIARSRSKSIADVVETIRNGGSEYRNLRNNYDFAALFTLKRRRPGRTKYYCGWQTLLALANGNIRYLLQLVSTILQEHSLKEGTLSVPVATETQTDCCATVGSEILRDSEGISLSGARLMKLVLALGQVFHELAVTPEGHAAEITQFEISNEATAAPDELEAVRNVLRDAVMHLALVRISGTKLGGDADTRTYDYMLHPIFAGFFRYSYRRKRKMGLSTAEIIGLIETPKPTITQILRRHHRAAPTELPGQLQLFGGFLDTSS